MKQEEEPLFNMISLLVGLLVITTVLVGLVGVVIYLGYSGVQFSEGSDQNTQVANVESVPDSKALVNPEGMWTAPDWNLVSEEPNAEDIQYGRELVSNTSEFLGPNGKVRKMSNGMNCQNCHLQAGAAPLGNNYAAVASTYPKVRARSGQVEDIPKRINDCFERSLNGGTLASNSKEMIAMVAYMEWLGKEVTKGEKPNGTGLYEVPLLDRAADPIKGKTVYDRQCTSCHMEDGQGVFKPDSTGYLYPPLWGVNSYNDGAGLFRLSRFAGYVRANMPLGATFENPIISDEEAWDLAAYVNSMDRPKKDISMDWPDISKKPYDHPFGPFSDGFDEKAHKFGPFQAIKEAKASLK